ncbi:MAG TPA: hypothetical protein VJ767_06420 [Nitrososphaeraceae archaeon]|nr:hypothetical protein [Nitrososphaeraceae archaeon]
MTQNNNRLENIVLTKTKNKISINEPISLNLSFKINGSIRDLFTQSTWEKAYNKFDNTFRIMIDADIKVGKKKIHSVKFLRKAIFFWARNPKIQHRIWVSIVKDDSPFYPLSEQESRSLLFDVNKIIEFSISDLNQGIYNFHADVRVSWGKHNFTGALKLEGISNQEQIEIIH